VGARVDRVLAGLPSDGSSVALFAHGHLLRVLAARWLGLPAAAGALFRLDTATTSELGMERERQVVVRWNVG
jgi:probable phosphoglycerate mutase